MVAGGALLVFGAVLRAWLYNDFDFDVGARHVTDAQIAAVVEQKQQEIRKWAWLKTVNPAQMARQDIEHKRFRFLQVCSYACGTVGMDDLHIDQCYPGVARDAIGPQGDAGLLPAEEGLQLKAYAIAQDYNRRMAAYLDAHGMRKCEGRRTLYRE